jgi:hypothetical protein
MLLEIPHLVRDLVPGARSVETLSVACVQTTHPKYLVFNGNPARPAFVVQFGPREQMERTHRTLLLVHAGAGDIVPQSLACASVGAGECVQIQTGLPGLPWFRVADRCRSRADWLNLLHRGLAALRQLQGAIAAVPEWTGTVDPGRELRALIQASRELHTADLSSKAAPWIDSLDRLGPIVTAYRHGDFSVNNLLIGDAQIGIIDFDEFGETMMPLHDEIGLALSLPLSQEGACPLSVRECLEVCVTPAITRGDVPAAALPGLLLHHLLWRIERCRDWPTRARLRATLTGYVRELLANPDGLLNPNVMMENIQDFPPGS